MYTLYLQTINKDNIMPNNTKEQFKVKPKVPSQYTNLLTIALELSEENARQHAEIAKLQQEMLMVVENLNVVFQQLESLQQE